jgi:hypothetical protein
MTKSDGFIFPFEHRLLWVVKVINLPSSAGRSNIVAAEGRPILLPASNTGMADMFRPGGSTLNHLKIIADLLKANTDSQAKLLEILMPPAVPDWSKIPDEWTFADAADFLMLLDGYALANEHFPQIVGDERDIGAGFRVFATMDSLNERSQHKLCALQIWVALSWQCRSDRWNEIDPHDERRPDLDQLWLALKTALAEDRYFRPDFVMETNE